MVDISDRGLPPTPPTGDTGDQLGQPGAAGGAIDGPASEDAPIGLRVGRNPGNLGDDVRDEGDLTSPAPAPAPEAVPEM